jgi:enediyne core biosynthesis thioesterase
MRLGAMVQNRISLSLRTYWRHADGRDEIIARGEQLVACMQRDGDRLIPTPVSAALRRALRPYAEAGPPETTLS